MKNVVKCYKDFFGYFNALKTHSELTGHPVYTYYDPQFAGINLQSPQSDSTPWTLTLDGGQPA